MTWTTRAALIAIALAATAPAHAGEGHATDSHAGHAMPAHQQVFGAERLDVAETQVLDQDGRLVSFRDDVLGDGPVILTFVYTSCTTVCPVANAVFQTTEAELDALGDGDVRLISISVDPARDTPDRLRAMAETFHAGPRWTLVTGRPADISRLLRSFGLAIGALEDHDPMFLVRRGGADSYVRVVGLPDARTLVDLALGSEGNG